MRPYLFRPQKKIPFLVKRGSFFFFRRVRCSLRFSLPSLGELLRMIRRTPISGQVSPPLRGLRKYLSFLMLFPGASLGAFLFPARPSPSERSWFRALPFTQGFPDLDIGLLSRGGRAQLLEQLPFCRPFQRDSSPSSELSLNSCALFPCGRFPFFSFFSRRVRKRSSPVTGPFEHGVSFPSEPPPLSTRLPLEPALLS